MASKRKARESSMKSAPPSKRTRGYYQRTGGELPAPDVELIQARQKPRKRTPTVEGAAVEVVELSPSKAHPRRNGRRGKGKSPASASASAADPPSDSLKTVIIETCKQCQSFKRTAMKVEAGLEKGVPGIVVKVNPEKPRRGCFEVREENGQKCVSLLDMKRLFTPIGTQIG